MVGAVLVASWRVWTFFSRPQAKPEADAWLHLEILVVTCKGIVSYPKLKKRFRSRTWFRRFHPNFQRLWMSRWALWFPMALPDTAYLDGQMSMLDPRTWPWYVLYNGWGSCWNMPRKLANPEILLLYAMMIGMKRAARFWLIWNTDPSSRVKEFFSSCAEELLICENFCKSCACTIHLKCLDPPLQKAWVWYIFTYPHQPVWLGDRELFGRGLKHG